MINALKIMLAEFPELNTESGKWEFIKNERTRRIEKIEKLLHDGVPISLAKKQEIQDYIQILRDIPQTFADRPDEVFFPEEPAYESV